MKKIILFLTALGLVTSCSGGVRYSPSELGAFSSSVQEHIKKAEVSPGMSQSAVRLAWGAPAVVKVPEPDDEGRYKEEWIYTRFRVMATRLIFTEGKLTAVLHGMAKRKPIFKDEEKKNDPKHK